MVDDILHLNQRVTIVIYLRQHVLSNDVGGVFSDRSIIKLDFVEQKVQTWIIVILPSQMPIGIHSSLSDFARRHSISHLQLNLCVNEFIIRCHRYYDVIFCEHKVILL